MTNIRKTLLAMASATSVLFCAIPELSLVEEARAQSSDTKIYSVLIHTSDIRKSGTGADVSITLYGTHAPDGHGPVLLDNRNEVDFERDEIGLYQIGTTTDLGEVTSIKLEHDNSRSGAGWHVGNVAVLDSSFRDPATLIREFERKKDQPRFTDLKTNKWVDSNLTIDGASFYKFDAWIASDEYPNQGAAKPTLSRTRADYKNFKKDLSKKFTVAPGEWALACQGLSECSAEVQTGKLIGVAESTARSSDYWAALSIGIENEGGVPGFGNSTLSSELEVGTNQSRSRENSTSRERTISFSCGGSVDLAAAGKDTLWQWNIKANFLGEEMSVRECRFTCTSDGAYPDFDASNPLSLKTCQAKDAAPANVSTSMPTGMVDAGQEQACFNLVQGKVAWNREGRKGWSPTNVTKLCKGTSNPAATIACFKAGIASHGEWSRAINACKA